MPLQILMAGAACGKTTEVLKKIRIELTTGDLKKIWVVLPDRRQATSFRTKLMNSGSMLGVSIGLFNEICKEILLKSDVYQSQAPNTMLHRIILEVIQSHSQQGMLGEFELIKEKSGFIQLVHQKFSELTQAGYSVTQPKLVHDENTAQLDIILALYDTYLERLRQLKWMDPHQIISVAVSTLESNPELVRGWNLVVVDGFESFTPPQQDLLILLAELGVRLIVTLPGDDLTGRVVYQRAQESLEKFQRTFSDLEIIHLGDQAYLPPSILGLANNFLVDQPQTIEKQPDVRLLAAHSPFQEVREVLRNMKKLLRVKSAFAGDCAVLVPDEVQYSPLLQTVADEYGIPLHFGWGQPLQQVPQIGLIVNLLRLTVEDFPRRQFLDVLRSPYLNLAEFGFMPSDAVRLERVSRFGPVIAGFENWVKVLNRLADQVVEADRQFESEEEDDNIFALPNAETSRRLLESIQKIAILLQPLQGQQRITAWVDWLWKLLKDTGWMSQLDFSESSAWFERFSRDLREMCISDLELGQWVLDYNQFVAELEMIFQISTYSQKLDENKIQVLRYLDARGSRFEHVAILGLAEGVFPKPQREDPFLPETFRRAAGLESSLEQDQIGVFYQGITRANTTLMVTRPYMSDKGEALEPSPYWNALIASVEKDDIETVRSTMRRDLRDAASIEELLFWSKLFNQPVQFDEEKLIETVNTINHQEQVLFARHRKLPEGEYEGKFDGLPLVLEKYNQKKTNWSASRLETYKSCPMRFWTQYALVVDEQRIPEVGLQSFQIGSILHQILEEVYKVAENPADVNCVLEKLPVVAKRIFDAAPEVYQFEPTAYWQTQQQEWLLILELTITGLASDEWVPIAFEQKFGLVSKPSLDISLEDGRVVRLHGVIDRVDRDPQGNIRVIDYKTGVSHLDKKDLIQGTRLQLPLYALAATQALNMGEVTEGFYWSLNAKKEGSLKLSTFQTEDFEGPKGAIQVAKQHIEMIMDGLTIADFRPQVPEGGCPNYCAARLWCWRYHPGRS
jgi:ATP-dependent helicase/nuclease subunit B